MTAQENNNFDKIPRIPPIEYIAGVVRSSQISPEKKYKNAILEQINKTTKKKKPYSSSYRKKYGARKERKRTTDPTRPFDEIFALLDINGIKYDKQELLEYARRYAEQTAKVEDFDTQIPGLLRFIMVTRLETLVDNAVQGFNWKKLSAPFNYEEDILEEVLDDHNYRNHPIFYRAYEQINQQHQNK